MNRLNFPKVYIILVNYNGWKDTIECLESIYRINYPDYQVIIVDNNSPDSSLHYIKEWANGNLDVFVEKNNPLKFLSFPPIQKPVPYIAYTQAEGFSCNSSSASDTPLLLIQADDNKGFAAGNNIAISYALKKNDFEYIWLLNNDTVIDKNALTALVQKAEKSKSAAQKVGIVSSKLLYYHHPDIIQGIGGKYNKWFAVSNHIASFKKDDGSFDVEEVKIDYAIGASMLVSQEFINAIGLMCEDYFLYYEEMDWSERGRQLNFITTYCYQSKVFHKEGASIGSGHTKLKSELSDIYSIRNRFKFTAKFYPAYLPTVYLGLAIVVINRLRRKQIKRIQKILKAVFDEVTR